MFRKVDVIFDVKKLLTPFLNKAIVYSQVPHKLLFQRHPYTRRRHMIYAVFSDEPMQPPEPDFRDVEAEVPCGNINISTFSLVGGRDKFMSEGLALPKTVCKLSSDQAATMAMVANMEKLSVFSDLHDSSISLRHSRNAYFIPTIKQLLILIF